MQVLRIKFKDGDVMHLMPEEKFPEQWINLIAHKDRVNLSVAQSDAKANKKKLVR